MKKRLSIKARLTLWYAALIVLMCDFALYEGEASLGEKLYEFEISINGDIIEWERD